MKKHSGFTIIELMVVIAIMGLVSTVVVINLVPTLKKTRIKNQASEIVTLLKQLRSQAIHKNKYFGLVFDDSKQSCYVIKYDPKMKTLDQLSELAVETEVEDQDLKVSKIVFEEGITFKSIEVALNQWSKASGNMKDEEFPYENIVIFNKYGCAPKTTVLIQNKNGTQYKIESDPVTGLFNAEEYYEEDENA